MGQCHLGWLLPPASSAPAPSTHKNIHLLERKSTTCALLLPSLCRRTRATVGASALGVVAILIWAGGCAPGLAWNAAPVCCSK